MAKRFNFCLIEPHHLAAVIRNHIDNVLILDSRSFLEYNVSHVINAVNVGCAKLMKRRLQQDRLTIQDFLAQNCHWDVEASMDIVVYDQSTQDPNYLPPDSFMSVFLNKLLPVYNSVNVLKGGFLAFQACYPNYCEDDKSKFTPLTSLSQPCLPISDHGPTRILPFLYLGSQHDALNKEVLQNHNITYELNVSTNCPKPDFIQDAHFMRISVIDNYSEKLLPHFPRAFQFLDKVQESGGCALVHCLAGISRSATVAIAYVMKHLKMSSDEAYRYVKSKRATISPNFNFLGQLLEYENQLQVEKVLSPKSKSQSATSSTPSSGSCEQKFLFQYSKPSEAHFNVQTPVSSESVLNSSSRKSESTKLHYFSGGQAVHGSSDVCHLSINGSRKEFSVSCIPASSLKQLSFVPCHAVLPTVEGNTMAGSHGALQLTNSWSVRMGQDKLKSVCPVPLTTASDPALLDTFFNDCKTESYEGMNALQAWPQKEGVSLSLSQVTFDPKEYNRSDSTSTSGVGSEGSDFLESFSDYHTSCERESDILMDEEYSTVPTEDDEYQTRKSLDLEEISLYGKYCVPLFHNPITKCSSDGQYSDFSASTASEDVFGSAERRQKRSATSNCPEDETVPNCLNEDLRCGKSDGLYRARSCPGILSHDSFPWTPSNCDHCVVASTAFRTRTNKSKGTDNRNRYSCSSLDYMQYTSQTGLLKSCPDVPSFGAPGPETTSHQIFRHSVIQVS